MIENVKHFNILGIANLNLNIIELAKISHTKF